MPPMYTQLMNRRPLLISVVAIVAAVVLGFYLFDSIPKPLPETVTFSSGNFSFDHALAFQTREYAKGVVAVGGSQTSADAFIPLIDVVEYKHDLQSAAPASFDAFVARQAKALCAADSSTETVACTDMVEKPFVTAAQLPGKEVSFTLIRTTVKTGAVAKSTFGPIFVFNTTEAPEPGEKSRYKGVFIYPTFSTFLLAPGTADFVRDIATTLVIQQ